MTIEAEPKKLVQIFNQNEFPVYVFEPKTETKGEILFLHGAGKADGPRMFPLCERLTNAGFRCLTFDFHGHGESKLDLGSTTLNTRKKQTIHVIEQNCNSEKLNIVAFSMAGQTAIEVAKNQNLGKIILFAPAMYSEAANDVNFGPAFSEILRTENSWKDSQVPSILETLENDVHTFVGDSDQVIPPEILKRYGTTTLTKWQRKLSYIKNQDHMISGRTNSDPAFANLLSYTIEGLLEV